MIGETAEIGDRVTLYQGVTLGGTGFQRGKRHPTLGDNVTVGSGAKLLGPIAVGDGAKIGANTVVVEDVPPGATVVGNPGHPVRVEGKRVEGPDADWIHLPDPIAEAIKALSERIAELERRLAELDGGDGAERRRRRSCARAPAAPRPAAEPPSQASRAAPLCSEAMLQTEFEMPAEASRRRLGAPTEAGADRVERLLAGLNQPQREAVEPRRGAAAGPRRRRLGQDPRAHPPDRLPAGHRRRRGRARSSRSPSPTRRRRRCASGSASWSAARCGRCG